MVYDNLRKIKVLGMLYPPFIGRKDYLFRNLADSKNRLIFRSQSKNLSHGAK